MSNFFAKQPVLPAHGANLPAPKTTPDLTTAQSQNVPPAPMAGDPAHVGVAPKVANPPLLGGGSNDVIGANVKSFKGSGQSEFEATRSALRAARPSQHKNLGKFLHPRKDGKPHGLKVF